ncbi:MAG: RimK/LysX family protein [Planctomycetota bacterium]
MRSRRPDPTAKERTSNVTGSKRQKPTIGWREWVALSELGVDGTKAKIDTGARSSALHAFELELTQRHGREYVRFQIHPIQRDAKTSIWAEARVHDKRRVKNSGGRIELRVVIRTPVRLMGEEFEIDLTLTRRDAMGFRMLLGREAVRGRFLINPGRSFLSADPPPKKRRKKKKKKKPSGEAKS